MNLKPILVFKKNMLEFKCLQAELTVAATDAAKSSLSFQMPQTYEAFWDEFVNLGENKGFDTQGDTHTQPEH